MIVRAWMFTIAVFTAVLMHFENLFNLLYCLMQEFITTEAACPCKVFALGWLDEIYIYSEY